MNTQDGKGRKGLTLIEMLVVIAIGFMLGGILLPVLFKTRGAARTVVCANNLSNLGVAFHTVMEPQNGYFTQAYYDMTPLPTGEWWVGLRDEWDAEDPLVSGNLSASFNCPSARGYVEVACASMADRQGRMASSYAYNVEMPIIARNLSRVPEPVTRVLLYDGDLASVVGTWEHLKAWPDRTIVPRHAGNANFLFLDGHVETTGAFSAEPLHGCNEFRVVRFGEGSQTSIEQAAETRGASSWVLGASVDIHQESHNVKNAGKFLQCTIRLPNLDDGVHVDPETIFLLGIANDAFGQAIQATPPINRTIDGQGRLLVQLKFDRQDVYDELVAGNHFGSDVPMKVVGQLENGRPFEGVDPNCVFYPPKTGK